MCRRLRAGGARLPSARVRKVPNVMHLLAAAFGVPSTRAGFWIKFWLLTAFPSRWGQTTLPDRDRAGGTAACSWGGSTVQPLSSSAAASPPARPPG